MTMSSRQLTGLREWEWRPGMELRGGEKVITVIRGPAGAAQALVVSHLTPGEQPQRIPAGQARPDPACPLVIDQLLHIASQRHGSPLELRAITPTGPWSVQHPTGLPAWKGGTAAEALLEAIGALG
jgi:hypothetical protein